MGFHQIFVALPLLYFLLLLLLLLSLFFFLLKLGVESTLPQAAPVVAR